MYSSIEGHGGERVENRNGVALLAVKISVCKRVAGECYGVASDVQCHRPRSGGGCVQDTDFFAGDTDTLAVVQTPVAALTMHRLPRGVVGRMYQDRCAEPFAEHHRSRNVGAMPMCADHRGHLSVAHSVGD
jgi:hypothetical protein